MINDGKKETRVQGTRKKINHYKEKLENKNKQKIDGKAKEKGRTGDCQVKGVNEIETKVLINKSGKLKQSERIMRDRDAERKKVRKTEREKEKKDSRQRWMKRLLYRLG